LKNSSRAEFVAAYRDEAAELMAKAYPSLKREAERLAVNAT
jgi:hypothetical protein